MCSEARITDKISSSEYQIDGYKCIECFSHNRHTGGAIIYIELSIRHEVILNSSDCTMLWILAIETWCNEANGIYAVFYRSPSQSVDVKNSLNALDQKFQQIINHGRFILINGDLNINMRKQNKYTQMVNDILDNHVLELCNNFITRDNYLNGTLIDVVLTNRRNQLICTALDHEKITDHKTILVEIETNCD